MRVIKWLDKNFEATFIAVGLVVIVAVMTSQIVYRKLFGASIIWSEELCRHIFIWSACWGLAYSIRKGNAIKFDIILGIFPEKAKYVFGIISNLIVAIFFTCIFKSSWKVIVSMKNTGSTALPYNLDFLYFIAFIGFVLSAVRALQMAVIDFRKLVKKTKDEEGKAV